MKGERPRQSHMAKYWDEAQEVGRLDVTDTIEDAIEGLGMSIRSYPDLYAHKITEALVKAGLLPDVRFERRTLRYEVNSGAPDFIPTGHVIEKERYTSDWVVTRDTERGLE